MAENSKKEAGSLKPRNGMESHPKNLKTNL